VSVASLALGDSSLNFCTSG